MSDAKWISVEERLPPDERSVLVAYHGMVDVGYFRDQRYCKNSPRARNCFSRLLGMFVSTATHWMPLPEPPKDGAQP